MTSETKPIEGEGGRARDRAWRHSERGRESMRVAMRVWRKRHPVEHSLEVARRKYLLRSAGQMISTSEWLDMVAVTGGRCFYCQRRSFDLTKDHILALRLGGSNASWNIVPACRSCNSRKRAQTAAEFMGCDILGTMAGKVMA